MAATISEVVDIGCIWKPWKRSTEFDKMIFLGAISLTMLLLTKEGTSIANLCIKV